MSLWTEYKKEVLNTETLERDGGLISYLISSPVCYIDVIYVQPNKRTQGIGARLADEVAQIAREKGCTSLHCQVWIGAQNPTLSMRAILAYGFRVVSAENNRIIFMKDISEGAP